MKILATTVCLALTPIAVFAETESVTTIAIGQANDFFDPLSGSLQLYKTETIYDQFEHGVDAKIQLSKMHCFGSMQIVIGLVAGGGHCALTDVDGDRILQSWSIDQVALGKGWGTWRFIAGTGKHEGISGRGLFANESVARTGQLTSTISGVVTWPD